MSRVRLISGALLGVAILVLVSACGGSEQGSSGQPRLPGALAEDLAQRSEAVRAQLTAGDTCAAASEARSLEQAIEAAIAEGLVPRALQPELVRTARTLSAVIRCEAESTPAATVEEAETEGETTPQPSADGCAQLEEELALLEEQKLELQEQKQEHEVDKDERKRQREALAEEKRAIENQKQALEQELQACEESGR